MRPLRYLPLWGLLGALLLGLLLYFCLEPPGEGMVFLLPDKLSHLLGFFALTLWFAALVERRLYAAVGVGMLAVGIAIEFAQDAMALGRSAELADVYADLAGILLGLLVSLAIRDSWFERIERWLSPT
jgi:VanZ family protein